MTGKVIPFRITVNSTPNQPEFFLPVDNAPMDSKTIEGTLSDLARERGLNAFHRDGRLNHNALARELSRVSGKPVNQSVLTRFINGKLKGKLDTLQPMASGYGLSLNEFLARVRPETTSTPLPSLPPEAAELWALWKQLPPQIRNHFTEQIKNSIAFAKQYPELAAAISGEALQAANATRVERARKRRPG